MLVSELNKVLKCSAISNQLSLNSLAFADWIKYVKQVIYEFFMRI